MNYFYRRAKHIKYRNLQSSKLEDNLSFLGAMRRSVRQSLYCVGIYKQEGIHIYAWTFLM